MAGAINATSFISVGAGYSIAASSSYLYACYFDSTLHTYELRRSADGVDWSEDPENIAWPLGVLIENGTHIVLTGDTTYVLAKSGSTWTAVDAGSIPEATSGGRYIGTRFFVFGDLNYYYSADNGSTWTAGSPARVVHDVGYDGTNYLILTTDRVYKTSNFSSFTPYPLPFIGVSIYHIDGVYWVSGYTGSSPADVYKSYDLNSFTPVFTSELMFSQFFSLDSVLFISNTSLSHLNLGSVSEKTTLPGVTTGGGPPVSPILVLKNNALLNREYLYVAGGDAIYRAVYDDNWKTAFALTLSTISPLPDAVVDEAYSQSVGSVSGGTAPYTWAITTKSWTEATTITGGTLSVTFTEASDSESVSFSVTDSSSPPQIVSGSTYLAVLASAVGTATIQGTLRLDTSNGAFAARTVYLYNYTTGEKVAETTSDGTTGAWSFTQVAPGDYFVVGAAQGDDLNVPRDFDALGVITVV